MSSNHSSLTPNSEAISLVDEPAVEFELYEVNEQAVLVAATMRVANDYQLALYMSQLQLLRQK